MSNVGQDFFFGSQPKEIDSSVSSSVDSSQNFFFGDKKEETPIITKVVKKLKHLFNKYYSNYLNTGYIYK